MSSAETFDLLTRWRAGDGDALGRLLDRDLDWIRAFVHRRLGTPLRKFGDTDDFVHEAALRVLREGPRFVLADRGQFRALLATIVLNVLRSRHRALHALRRDVGREQALGTDTILCLDPPQDRVPQPDHQVEQAEQEEWLRLGFLLLSEDDQAVIDMHWQGRTDPEIGTELGIAGNTARMRRQRATARLAKVVLDLKAGHLAQLLPAD